MSEPIWNVPTIEEQNALLAQINDDESRVTPWQIPNPLLCEDGLTVDTIACWRERRRPEILRLFEDNVYGRMLPATRVHGVITETHPAALNGKAIRRQITLTFPDLATSQAVHLVLHLPANAQGPVPCFLGLSFGGNQAAYVDPAIPLSTAWMRPPEDGVIDHRATEASRGTGAYRWPLEMIIDRGYALATAYYGDLEPDYETAFTASIRTAFMDSPHSPKGNRAGAITAWAWGLSRIMDYLTTLPELDASRICLTGHSRLGKTALWAAACDERFALVISNNSGCGGASFNRRNFGETLAILSNVRTHWFCENCRTRSQDAEAMPIDQHHLLALIAPRPVLISSASADHGADPTGEFLTALYASPVFRLLGEQGLAVETKPALNTPVLSNPGYVVREGQHNIFPMDWQNHLDFADRHLPRR